MNVNLLRRNSCMIVAAWSLLATASCSREPQKTTSPERPAAVDSLRQMPAFDGMRAFAFLERQVAFGSRVINTAAHDSCRRLIVGEVKKYAARVDEQDFTLSGYDNEALHCTNIIASFDPKNKQRVMLCAHWDCRPRADADMEQAYHKIAIAGANDGASGVAVLLEIARLLAASPPAIGVDLVFFDAEDYGKQTDLDLYCLGSRYFAQHLTPSFQGETGILLDLVGDREATFGRDPQSMQFARDIVADVWAAAQRVNAFQFVDATGKEIFDDHVPLNNAGMRVIDIIDADLVGNESAIPRRRYWHTMHDKPENCSGATLQAVGATVMQYLYSRPAHP